MLDLQSGEFEQYDEFCYRGNVSPKRLISHMIRLLDRELSWQGEEDSMSLRGLWYSGVKTVLQRAFTDEWDDPSVDANRRYSKYLSGTLSEMVKDGEVSYRGLNIVDDSRERHFAESSDIEDDKILFVEKEAAYRRLKPIADVFQLSLVSGGGWEATALIEDMAHSLEPDEEYHLFVLTDFDPTGYNIADDFASRSQTLGANITEVERIGINPDQVDERTRTQERFRVPVETESDEQWLRRHGIDNEFGLEIEAIGGVGEGGTPLRRIVVEELEDHLDVREHRRSGRGVATASTIARGADDAIDNITSDLEDALREWACDRAKEEEPVKEAYQSGDEIRAYVTLAESSYNNESIVPHPLPFDRYMEAAIQGEDRPLPHYGTQQGRLREEIGTAIEEGELDLESLLDITS